MTTCAELPMRFTQRWFGEIQVLLGNVVYLKYNFFFFFLISFRVYLSIYQAGGKRTPSASEEPADTLENPQPFHQILLRLRYLEKSERCRTNVIRVLECCIGMLWLALVREWKEGLGPLILMSRLPFH